MNKVEFIKAVAASTGHSVATTRSILECAFSKIEDEMVAGRCVLWSGFGAFHPVMVGARYAYVPGAGEKRMVQKHIRFCLRPSRRLKDKGFTDGAERG